MELKLSLLKRCPYYRGKGVVPVTDLLGGTGQTPCLDWPCQPWPPWPYHHRYTSGLKCRRSRSDHTPWKGRERERMREREREREGPAYPVASMVFLALNLCMLPSSMHMATTPLHSLPSIIRSRAKYSMKYWVLYRRDCRGIEYEWVSERVNGNNIITTGTISDNVLKSGSLWDYSYILNFIWNVSELRKPAMLMSKV